MRQFWEIYRKTPVNHTLILINMIVFLLVELTGGSQKLEHMIRWGAMFMPYVIEKQEYYRLVTSMFLHFGLAHLLNNMLLLYILGTYLEPALGEVRYALVYIAGGIGGNLLSGYLELRAGTAAVSAGASGGVFAVMGGLIGVLILNQGRLADLTTKKMLVMTGLALYYGLIGSSVDDAAHVGGLVCGLLLALVSYPRRSNYNHNLDS